MLHTFNFIQIESRSSETSCHSYLGTAWVLNSLTLQTAKPNRLYYRLQSCCWPAGWLLPRKANRWARDSIWNPCWQRLWNLAAHCTRALMLMVHHSSQTNALHPIACWCTAGTAASDDTINKLALEPKALMCIASRHATLWDFWPSGRQINFIFGQRVNHHWLSPAGATITRCPVKKRHEHPAKGQKMRGPSQESLVVDDGARSSGLIN